MTTMSYRLLTKPCIQIIFKYTSACMANCSGVVSIVIPMMSLLQCGHARKSLQILNATSLEFLRAEIRLTTDERNDRRKTLNRHQDRIAWRSYQLFSPSPTPADRRRFSNC